MRLYFIYQRELRHVALSKTLLCIYCTLRIPCVSINYCLEVLVRVATIEQLSLGYPGIQCTVKIARTVGYSVPTHSCPFSVQIFIEFTVGI